MQAAFATKKRRTEMLKPTQPMKFWNESHMINKIIRPVHKPITRHPAESTDYFKLASHSIACQVTSPHSDPSRLLPSQTHVFRNIPANTTPPAPIPAKTLIASPPTLYCPLRSPDSPTPRPPVGIRLSTHHTTHTTPSHPIPCHDSETRMCGRTMCFIALAATPRLRKCVEFN